MPVEHYCSSVQGDRWRQWQTCDGAQNEDGGGELGGEVQTRVEVIGEVEIFAGDLTSMASMPEFTPLVLSGGIWHWQRGRDKGETLQERRIKTRGKRRTPRNWTNHTLLFPFQIPHQVRRI